jgi:hypothetical protein
MGFGLAVHHFQNEADLVANPGHELRAIGRDAAGLGRDEAGAGVPANFESGVSVYFVCTACIAAMSAGPFSCVRVSVPTKSVSARKTLVIPFGTSPFQRGPAKR